MTVDLRERPTRAKPTPQVAPQRRSARAKSLLARGNTCVAIATVIAMFGISMYAGLGSWHPALWWFLGLVAGLSGLAWLCFGVAARIDSTNY